MIATPGNMGSTLAAKAATAAIPIVFGVPDDPAKFGLVVSFAHPGGNATGINYFVNEIVTKRLGLLHKLVPEAQRVALLVNPTDRANAETTEKEAAASCYCFCGIGVVPVGPIPVVWRMTSPSFAQT